MLAALAATVVVVLLVVVVVVVGVGVGVVLVVVVVVVATAAAVVRAVLLPLSNQYPNANITFFDLRQFSLSCQWNSHHCHQSYYLDV